MNASMQIQGLKEEIAGLQAIVDDYQEEKGARVSDLPEHKQRETALVLENAMVKSDNKKLHNALARQCDNMAYILNHVDVKKMYSKFVIELDEDRKVKGLNNV